MTQENRRFWTVLTVFSLVGQIAWVIENMYFNVFLYRMFAASAADISVMVMASAVTAALTTLFMGYLSDRLGRRRVFMSLGYCLWGVSILLFAAVRTDVLSPFVRAGASVASLAIALVIALDCVMTFFGSTANDAAFNAWLTDRSAGPVRGRAEAINAMMPLLAVLVVFGGFSFFDLSSQRDWTLMYLIIGGGVFLIGLAGFFLIEEKRPASRTPVPLSDLFYGFRPSVVRQHPQLYLTLLSFTVFGIAIQIFMPFLIIYYAETLRLEQYVLILAPAIVLSAVFTALYGRVYDKSGFRTAVFPPMALLCAGFVILTLFTATPAVFVGSLLMMSGYLSGMAVFGAMLRDHTPVGKAGVFQAPRIVGQVLIPGMVGPAIGTAVLRGAAEITLDDGTTQFLPNRSIFAAALVAGLLAIGTVLLLLAYQKRNPCKLSTVLPADAVPTPAIPHSLYPRPAMRRDSYLCLNGAWEYGEGRGQGELCFDRSITVPYPPQSTLSGIGHAPRRGSMLCYRRRFSLPKGFCRGRVLLQFGAVDQCCTVLLGGTKVGEHRGGYLPFTVDITDALCAGENELTVLVRDDDAFREPHGKQRARRGGMWYTPISGIWQTVWLESVPTSYIRSVSFSPIGTEGVSVTVDAGGADAVLTGDDTVGTITLPGGQGTVRPANPHLWTPDDPLCYQVSVSAGEDTVQTYFAIRSVENKAGRLHLNGEPVFLNGLLDQGYFPDGIFLPPDPLCWRDDIRRAKDMGFNMLRKHIKIEPQLFYYFCDTVGIAVVQDMVQNGKYRFLRDTALPTLGKTHVKDDRPPRTRREQERRQRFLADMEGTAKTLQNHPSILMWTVFNEGWGQFEADRCYDRLRALDAARPIDATSGWFPQTRSDFNSIHVYFKPIPPRRGARTWFLSEFGGYACAERGHVFQPSRQYGYRSFGDRQALQRAVTALYEKEVLPAVQAGLSAAVYTQLCDIEDEVNGVYTYDRKVAKCDPAEMCRLSEKLMEAALAYKETDE